MKFFIIKYKDNLESFWLQKLLYIPEEHSFFMENIVRDVEIELVLKTISLGICNNMVVNVSGFCGLNSFMKSNFQVPKYQKGILNVVHNLKFGYAYGIYNYDLPVHVNHITGWICIGDPYLKGSAVEFIQNCVAIIDINNMLLSLWLRP